MAQQRVVIIEDQVTFREMLAELLRLETSYEVVGQYTNGRQALDALENARANLVIVDLLLPDISGLDLLRQVRQQWPDTRVLVVTAQERPNVILEAFRAGAHGIITKGTSLAELRAGIQRVAQNGTFYCPVTSALLREHARQPVRQVLSEREQQIVRLIALGRSSKEIAQELGIAPKTVANHRHRIAQRLGLGDIATLTRYAIAQGWVAENA